MIELLKDHFCLSFYLMINKYNIYLLLQVQMSDIVNSTDIKDLDSKLISSSQKNGNNFNKSKQHQVNKISFDSSSACQIDLDSQVHSLLSMPSTARLSGSKMISLDQFARMCRAQKISENAQQLWQIQRKRQTSMDFDGLGLGHSQGLEDHGDLNDREPGGRKIRPFVGNDSVLSGPCEDIMVSLTELDKVKMIAYQEQVASGGGGPEGVRFEDQEGIEVGDGPALVRKSVGDARSGEMIEIDLKSIVGQFMDSHHRQISARTTENEMSSGKKYKQDSANHALKLNDLISSDNNNGTSHQLLNTLNSVKKEPRQGQTKNMEENSEEKKQVKAYLLTPASFEEGLLKNISNSCYKNKNQKEHALKTQVYNYNGACKGVYNSTGTQQEEIDEKVFISQSKKSLGRSNNQLVNSNNHLHTDLIQGSQSGRIPECFLMMECDESVDDCDQANSNQQVLKSKKKEFKDLKPTYSASSSKLESNTFQRDESGLLNHEQDDQDVEVSGTQNRMSNQQYRLRNLRHYSSDQEIISKIYDQVKPLEGLIPSNRKMDERQRYSSQKVLQIFSQNNSDMGANKSCLSRQDNDKIHILGADEFNSQSNPTSMVTGSKFLKQKNQSNLPQIPCSLKVYVNEDHIFKQRCSGLRSPFAYQTASLMNTNENMFSNGYTHLGESVHFLNDGPQSANSTTLQQPLTNKYPSSLNRPLLVGHPLFRGPNLYTSSSAKSQHQHFHQFNMHIKHKSAASGGVAADDSVTGGLHRNHHDLASGRLTSQRAMPNNSRVNSKLQLPKQTFQSLIGDVLSMVKQQMCQDCSSKDLKIDKCEMDRLFEKYCREEKPREAKEETEEAREVTQEGNIDETNQSDQIPVEQKVIQSSFDQTLVAVKKYCKETPKVEMMHFKQQKEEDVGQTESINNSPIQLFTVNSSIKNQSNQKSLLNTSKLGRDLSHQKNMKKDTSSGQNCLNLNLQRCVTGGSSRGASTKKKYQLNGSTNQNHCDTQKRLQRVLISCNEQADFSRNLSASQVDYSLSLSNQGGIKISIPFEKHGCAQQQEMEELNRGYQVENEEEEEYDHVSLLPSSYVMANIEQAKAKKQLEMQGQLQVQAHGVKKNSQDRPISSQTSIFEHSDPGIHPIHSKEKFLKPSESPLKLSTQIKEILMGSKQSQSQSASANYIKDLSSHKKLKKGNQKRGLGENIIDANGKITLVGCNQDSCNVNDSTAEQASENYISFANHGNGDQYTQGGGTMNRRANDRLPRSNVPQISIVQWKKIGNHHANPHAQLLVRSIQEQPSKLEQVVENKQIIHYFTERSPNLETQINANFDDVPSSQKKDILDENPNDDLSPIKKFSMKSSINQVNSVNNQGNQGVYNNQLINPNSLEATRKQPLTSKPKIDAQCLNQMQISQTQSRLEVKDFKVFNFQNKSRAYQITQQNNSLLDKINPSSDGKSDSKKTFSNNLNPQTFFNLNSATNQHQNKHPNSSNMIGTVPQTVKADMIQGMQKHRNSVQNFFESKKLSTKDGGKQSCQISEQKATQKILKTFDCSINMAKKKEKYKFDDRQEYYSKQEIRQDNNLKNDQLKVQNSRVHHVCKTQMHRNIFQKGKYPASSSNLFKSTKVDQNSEYIPSKLSQQRTVTTLGTQVTDYKSKNNVKPVKEFFIIDKKKYSVQLQGTSGIPQQDSNLKSYTGTYSSNLHSVNLQQTAPTKPQIHHKPSSTVLTQVHHHDHKVNPSKITTHHSREDSSVRQEFSYGGDLPNSDRVPSSTAAAPGDPGHPYRHYCEQKISRLSNPFRFESTGNVEEDVAEECAVGLGEGDARGGAGGAGLRYKNLTIDVEEIEKFHYDLMQNEMMQEGAGDASGYEEQESYEAPNEYNLVENQSKILATAECEDDDEYKNAENYLSTQQLEANSHNPQQQQSQQQSFFNHQKQQSIVPAENSYMSLESFKNKLGKGIVQNVKIS